MQSQIPKAAKGLICPLHKKDVSQVCHKCPWWMSLRGKNPNTGEEVDQWGCAIGFLPMLLIENAAQSRGAAAATEDARNQIVDTLTGAADTLVGLANQASQRRLPSA